MAAEAVAEPVDLVAMLQALELDGRKLPSPVRLALNQAAQTIDRQRAAMAVVADTLDTIVNGPKLSVMASGSTVDAWAKAQLNTLRELARQLRA